MHAHDTRWDEARSGLRAFRASAVLLTLAGALALVAALPVAAFTSNHLVPVGTTLTPQSTALPDFGIGWTPLAHSVEAIRDTAIRALFRLLVGVAAGALAVAGLTSLSIGIARGNAREGELTVRRAVGASRGRLRGVLGREALVLASVAVATGGALGVFGAVLAGRAWPGPLAAIALWPSAFAVACAAGGVAIGAVLPLLFLRPGKSLAQVDAPPLHLTIPALQLGLGLAVLSAAGLVGREAQRLLAVTSTTDVQGRLIHLTLHQPDPAARARTYASLLTTFRHDDPGGGIALMSPGTLSALGPDDKVVANCGMCTIYGMPVPWRPLRAAHYVVSADTFAALGMPILEGRGITDADTWDATPVVVVTRSMAHERFESGRAVGHTVRIGAGAGERLYTVVGVVDDRVAQGLGRTFATTDAVYLSVLQAPPESVNVFVPTTASSAVADRAIAALGAETTESKPTAVYAADVARIDWFSRMLGGEGWITLVLATFGAYVVMRLWVTSRFQELGVRRAVGARRAQIVRYVLWRACGVGIAGVMIGLWASFFTWGWLEEGIGAEWTTWDPAVLLHVAPLLLLATLAGALEAAWRAARTPPVRLVEAP